MAVRAQRAALARAELTERCGENRLWQVERLERHTWRGWLTDGGAVIAMVLPDGTVKIWEQEVGTMYQQAIMERQVRRRLAAWFGAKRVDRVEPADDDGSCWRARLTDGGLAYATVEEDGSISIEEREVVC